MQGARRIIAYTPSARATIQDGSMSSKWTATSVVVGGALATWLANAATSNHETAPPPAVRAAPIDGRGAGLAEETARLHDPLRPTALPQTPARNALSLQCAA